MHDEKPRARGEPKARDENRDPLSGAPGSHPIGTGIGAAAGGAAAGAAAGTVAGPIGTVIGAAAGAIAGGLAGKGIAEAIDPTAEDGYWREHYADRPYVGLGRTYEDYGPAYRYGVDAYRNGGHERGWQDIEPELEQNWYGARSASRLEWSDARHAARDAWGRLSDMAGSARSEIGGPRVTPSSSGAASPVQPERSAATVRRTRNPG